MRSEGYSTWSVCLSVRASSRTTGYEAANEGHQRLLSKENIGNEKQYIQCKPSAKCACAVPLIDGLGF